MASLYLLIPLGVGVVIAALLLFLWASSGGQFDDLEDLSSRLPDDER
ncbi:MAG TPA: cbb3-type cytochrome oxidase assembly protein CcoS [Nevskia sp.]|nr:cbb3-type cytochrome oxidase assembly protein CcoS [Nevskia sp.]